MPELVFAAASGVRQEGRRLSAQLLGAAASPQRGPKLAKRLTENSASETPVPYTSEEAHALLVDLGLSKAQYIRLRTDAKANGPRRY